VRDNQGGEPTSKIPQLSDFVISHKLHSAHLGSRAKDGTVDNDDNDEE
jgi:hypothetical protein